MAIPVFNIHKFRQNREEEKIEQFMAQAQARHEAMEHAAARNQARIASYSEGYFGDIVDFVTKSLATPAFHKEWKKIIRAGEDGGFSGLNRSEPYRAFQAQAQGYVRDLSPDQKNLGESLLDALRPENMADFLGKRLGSTDPNPRDSLQRMLSHHISPKDQQALADAHDAEQYRRRMLSDAEPATHSLRMGGG